MSLRQHCLDVVNRLGEVTVTQVVGEVGKNVSTTAKATTGRRLLRRVKTPKVRLIDQGVRQMVNDTLSQLCRIGKIRRVRHGVYAPLLPKLFTPAQSA